MLGTAHGIVTTHLPCHEADSLHDRGLDNLLAREDSPGDRVRALGVRIRPQVTGLVEHVVRDAWVALDVHEKLVQQLRTDEELEVCLLHMS